MRTRAPARLPGSAPRLRAGNLADRKPWHVAPESSPAAGLRFPVFAQSG